MNPSRKSHTQLPLVRNSCFCSTHLRPQETDDKTKSQLSLVRSFSLSSLPPVFFSPSLLRSLLSSLPIYKPKGGFGGTHPQPRQQIPRLFFPPLFLQLIVHLHQPSPRPVLLLDRPGHGSSYSREVFEHLAEGFFGVFAFDVVRGEGEVGAFDESVEREGRVGFSLRGGEGKEIGRWIDGTNR